MFKSRDLSPFTEWTNWYESINFREWASEQFFPRLEGADEGVSVAIGRVYSCQAWVFDDDVELRKICKCELKSDIQPHYIYV